MDLPVSFYLSDQRFDLLFLKTQPVHPGVKLDMDLHRSCQHCVLCNGFFQQPEYPEVVNLGDHTAWNAQIAAWSARYRVIAPDSRGAGQSTPRRRTG